MKLREIEFNGKRSFTDMGITISPDSVIGSPAVRRVKVTVPYKDGEHDFSSLDGVLHYDDRTLKYIFNVRGISRSDLYKKSAEITAWISANGNGELYDDDFPDTYFLGVKLDSFDFEIQSRSGRHGLYTANFTASPKRRKKGSTIMTVAEFTPTANTSEYIWLYAGDKLYYNCLGDADVFDTKIISADKTSISATINVTDWDKGVVKIQVPSFIEQVLARIDGNILTPSITLDSQYYYVVGSGHHTLSLTFTAYSEVSISDSMAQYVTAVGFSAGLTTNTPPSPKNMMISAVESLPQVKINGAAIGINNIELSDDLTAMEISRAKGDKLRLVYDDTEDMI